MIRSSCLLVLMCLIVFHRPCQADDHQVVITPGTQYSYAQALLKDQDYETALVEFKRFVHFFPDNNRLDQARFNIGVCLFNLKKYSQAARVFNELITESNDHAINPETYFIQSKAFVNLGNTGYAQLVLQNYLKLVDDQTIIDRIYFELGQIHLADASKFKKSALQSAKENLLKISEAGTHRYGVDAYIGMIEKALNAPQKNPTAAGILAVLPGAGYLYCERYKDALVTFLLNAGLIAAAYTAYEDGNYALAGVIGFVETGFYTGNIYGSITSAHKYNRAATLRILNRDIAVRPSLLPGNAGVAVSFHYPF
jgi:tetratricopeptide (TPR) repeat protein